MVRNDFDTPGVSSEENQNDLPSIALRLESLNQPVHMFPFLDQANADKTYLGKASLDFIVSIGPTSGGGNKHVDGEDGTLLWMSPVRFHDVIPDDNSTSGDK